MFNIFHKSKIATKLLNNNFSQKITQIFTHRKLDTNSAEELKNAGFDRRSSPTLKCFVCDSQADILKALPAPSS